MTTNDKFECINIHDIHAMLYKFVLPHFSYETIDGEIFTLPAYKDAQITKILLNGKQSGTLPIDKGFCSLNHIHAGMYFFHKHDIATGENVILLLVPLDITKFLCVAEYKLDDIYKLQDISYILTYVKQFIKNSKLKPVISMDFTILANKSDSSRSLQHAKQIIEWTKDNLGIAILLYK